MADLDQTSTDPASEKLRLAAAMTDPYPTLWIETSDEADLLARLAQIGSPPQADIFEPFEPGIPWMARILWPLAPDAADESAIAGLLAVGSLESGEAPVAQSGGIAEDSARTS